MAKTHGITSATAYYENAVQQRKDSIVKEKGKATSEPAVKSSEDKLSSRAKNYLDNLRKAYGDYDFIVADASDDKRALLDKSDKEFSVIFSNAELERMANDEDYANEKMRQVETIIDMSERICEQFGFERALEKGNGNDAIINKLAVSINDDGSMSIFAVQDALEGTGTGDSAEGIEDFTAGEVGPGERRSVCEALATKGRTKGTSGTEDRKREEQLPVPEQQAKRNRRRAR